MKLFNKSIVMLIMAAVFVIGFGYVNADAATKVVAGKNYTGKLSGDEIEYTYITTGEGYFYTEVAATSDGYLFYEIWKDFKKYDEGRLDYGDGAEKSIRLSFNKGTKVTIKVSSTYSSPSYSLKVCEVNPKNFETESNDSKKKANSLKLKETTSGIINHKGDDDWFVFKAPKKGRYVIKGVKPTDDNYVHSCVYKGTKNIGSTTMYGGSGWYTLFSGKLKKGQKIYVNTFGEYCTNNDYKLKVTKKK